MLITVHCSNESSGSTFPVIAFVICIIVSSQHVAARCLCVFFSLIFSMLLSLPCGGFVGMLAKWMCEYQLLALADTHGGFIKKSTRNGLYMYFFVWKSSCCGRCTVVQTVAIFYIFKCGLRVTKDRKTFSQRCLRSWSVISPAFSGDAHWHKTLNLDFLDRGVGGGLPCCPSKPTR